MGMEFQFPFYLCGVTIGNKLFTFLQEFLRQFGHRLLFTVEIVFLPPLIHEKETKIPEENILE